MRILVVCGAGASSTFVALRLRRAAEAAGLEWDCSAGSADAVAGADADLILVGPHLADRLRAIRDEAAGAVLPLPEDVFTDRDGGRTLALVRSALALDAEASEKGTS
ncbi:PTS sugar transporter subunit IIB [Microbacterium sp. SD291]|uniref:PTS sugar transporter subunit IIB n=1 Tax=Microbacterium sp. SD291 TaxID=2782007 RepID=UPI001A96FC82|nr:hypothetical protein [Microbacterium sp. SD291]MBO0981069.1 hypothetical protein [Microbacterium sp. SD291]